MLVQIFPFWSNDDLYRAYNPTDSNKVTGPTACLGGTRGLRDVCYNATGELLLWGPTLYDPRAPRRVHAFDLFADSGGASSFHPAGLEAVLNSEARTLSLLTMSSLACVFYNDLDVSGMQMPPEVLGLH